MGIFLEYAERHFGNLTPCLSAILWKTWRQIRNPRRVVQTGRRIKLRLHRVNPGNGFRVVFTILMDKKTHTKLPAQGSSHTFPHAITRKHTYTYHSGTTAKHTTRHIWTVSLTDQTHVDSLTFDLSMYDYSSSSRRGLGYDPAPHIHSPLFTFKSNLYFQPFLHLTWITDEKAFTHTLNLPTEN